MTKPEILAGIEAVAREHIAWRGELALEQRLVEDLELDSLRRLTLAVEVENYFRVALDEEDDEGIETVADLVEAVAEKLAPQGLGPGGSRPERRP